MLTAARTPPEPPAAYTPADRSAVWAGAVLAAVAALTRQLADDDPAVVRVAAESILDLEKTLLRHGREEACADHTPDPPADAKYRQIVEKFRLRLQAWEDRHATGRTISPAEAEAFWRRVREKAHAGGGAESPHPAAAPPPSPSDVPRSAGTGERVLLEPGTQ